MIPIAKPLVGEEEKKAVEDVLNSGTLAQGEKVKELEKKFAKFCETNYAVAVNSGTAALHCCLYAAGIKKGEEVITTPFSFIATANSIIMQNAKVIFADIKEDTFNLDPDSILKKITDKTKAIIPVHLYGQCADMGKIMKIAREYDLKIIEDACQAHGACLDGRKAGSFGDLAAFSFYATKNMTSGEGGIVTTGNEKLAELVKRFRHHGQSEQTKYEYYDLGYNYRMMDLQAAIALAQLEKIEEFTEKRIENAKLLTEGLREVESIEVPFVKPNARHVFHQYTIKVKDRKRRDKLVEYLKEKGIGYGIYYPKPLHLHAWFLKQGYKEGDFPVAEKVSKEVISLPVHPALSQEEIKQIVEVIRGLFGKI